MITRTKAGFLLLLGLAGTQFTHAEQPTRHNWWFDIGAGPASVSAGHDAPVSGTSTLLDGAIGGRLNERWLMGLQLGGTATSASDNNDNNLGGTLSHYMLAVRYVPRSDHGWIWGLGVGPVVYNNAAEELFTGKYDSGNGWAGNAALGFDWKLGQRSSHVQAMLNFERGRYSLSSPLAGQFSYTTVAASVHYAWY